ncbi:MAG: Zn-ribbon domain-containing OB-fold protein [Candidatus Aenigmatarchaeota archaeon]
MPLSPTSAIPVARRIIKNRYRLIGSLCENCKSMFMPPRIICPNCRRKGKMKDYEFSGEGEIYSFTILNTAPEGFEYQKPYIVGIIKLKEGVLFTSQIIGKPEEIKIGKKVRPVFRRFSVSEDGFINYGLKFEVVEE